MKLGKHKKSNNYKAIVLAFNWYYIYQSIDDGSTEAGGGEDEKKRQKRGGKGMLKTKKKEDIPRLVTVSRAPRGKKKSVTVVTGLSTFGKALNQFWLISNKKRTKF